MLRSRWIKELSRGNISSPDFGQQIWENGLERKSMPMLPEEKARVKIDKQLRNAGWDIVARNEYLPNSTSAVKEALMRGNTESD